MKTPMQELIEKFRELQQMSQDNAGFLFSMWLTECEESLLEKEKEFITNFAMDYVSSGNVGCAIWADGPPELDIEKNARDYYKEYIHTTSLDSTEWSNTNER